MRAVKSWMEISGARLAGNLRAVQRVAGTDVEVLAVVKANGYGHDAKLVAEALVEVGARWLGVSDVEEGARVRAACPSARILVMCAMEAADAPALLEQRLTPVVWTLEQVQAMESAAKAAGRRADVHVEVDTGMSRQGVVPGAELAQLLQRLALSEWVVCEGLLSHLCCSEIAGTQTTAEQQRRFEAALQQVPLSGLALKFVHLGNTSAVDEGSTTAWVQQAAAAIGARAMVRTGLALYGHCLPIEAAAGQLGAGAAAPQPELLPHLQPVETWKTCIVGLRDIAAGTTVGYGATFVAEKSMRLALLPVGYADGFRREASSGVGDGWVMIAGRKARVIGRVSMNLTTVDVTGIDAAVGDETVLLGEGATAEDHARWCGTIAYEVLCGIRARITLV